MEINLLAAPVILPPTPEANSASTSLVPIDRLAVATRTITGSDTAYPDDRFVWSVAAGKDGSFLFYAVPQTNAQNGGASNQRHDFLAAHAVGLDWNALNMCHAAAQYALLASMPMSMYAHLLNVYA